MSYPFGTFDGSEGLPMKTAVTLGLPGDKAWFDPRLSLSGLISPRSLGKENE
jgi:hypothetical protein